MFRQTALKKGHLKPIHAQIGTMVGPAYTPPPVPALRAQPTRMERIGTGLKRFGRGIFGIPQIGGYVAGEKVAQGLGIEDPIGKTAFGLGGSYAATRALPALAGIGMVPSAIGLATIAAVDNRVKAGIAERKRINAMSPEERAEFSRQNRLKATDVMSEGVSDADLFGNFKPKTPEELNAGLKRPDSKRPGPRRFNTDRLTETGNESEIVKGSVEIDKVVKNNDPNTPVTVGGADTVEEKGFKDEVKVAKQEKITNKQANTKVVNSETNKLDKPGKYKAADGTEITSPVIELARKYRKELMAGQKSQAGLVFLSNLASGLLSGKSMQGGLGGALEIFGKALGPAVNNYATIKLKENELENEFMSDALELASDEIDARNAVLETPSLDFQKYGIVQFTDKNGRLRNVTGGMLKNGTYVIAQPGQLDQNGQQIFSPVAAGTFDRFLESEYATKEQGQTLRNLSGKYKALNLGQSTIDILTTAEAQDKKFAGPVGRFNLFTTRLGDAMADLNLNLFSSKEDGERYIQDLKNQYTQELIEDGMSEKEAQQFLEKNFGSTDKLFKDTLKSLGVYKDQTDAANLERLAINETVLTYALANSLKDKDRLTQKDIQMAKELVNVFPLLRGQKQVIKSLEAVNETILADIKRLEDDYQFAFGGDSSTIDRYRIQYGVLEKGAEPGINLTNPFADESTQDLLERY